LAVSAAELFKGQRQHSKNNEFKKPIPKPPETTASIMANLVLIWSLQ
jgi:hypothetical protein